MLSQPLFVIVISADMSYPPDAVNVPLMVTARSNVASSLNTAVESTCKLVSTSTVPLERNRTCCVRSRAAGGGSRPEDQVAIGLARVVRLLVGDHRRRFMLQSVADVTCDGEEVEGGCVSRVVLGSRDRGGGDGHRGVGSAARTESDVLERVGLIRLDADLQVGLGVAEGGLCVEGRVESVERGERRGGGRPAGRRTAESNNSPATSGGRDERRRARTRRPFFGRSAGSCTLVPPGTASVGRSREVRGGGAGAGQSGRQGASFRRWEAARETPTSSSRSRSRGGRTARPARDHEYARAAIVPRGEAIEARVVISTPRTREVVARDAPRSARWAARQQRRSAQTQKGSRGRMDFAVLSRAANGGGDVW